LPRVSAETWKRFGRGALRGVGVMAVAETAFVDVILVDLGPGQAVGAIWEDHPRCVARQALAGGRAPGWRAGVVLADRQMREQQLQRPMAPRGL
jgi:hypothetical protein